MGLITETNAQYYSGQQSFIGDGTAGPFTCNFDTDLVATVVGISNTNFSITVNGIDWIQGSDYNLTGLNEITFLNAGPAGAFPAIGASIIVQLNDIALWDNYNSYSYISLDDVINNFIVAYVGKDKLIPDVKRTDVMFHAKRGLQEFSYDTLKSVKTQEVTIPTGLSVIIPQDYVNYVQLSWIDNSGVKRIIYPTDLTVRPTDTPIQDNTPEGVPIQDDLEENTQGTSLTNERWDSPATQNQLISNLDSDFYDYRGIGLLGERYGLETSLAQRNGWFIIDERKGKFSFSSELVGQLITIEYISDGLAYDRDTRIPKFAEQALYMHIAYSILSTRMNIPEYVVQRFKKDRRAALRNAKIRLSNIKLNDFIQIMRGQAKWIKH